MPTKPKKLCRSSGCCNLTENRYCEQHHRLDKKLRDQRREGSTQRGYDGRWNKYRITFLRSHPLCVRCLSQEKVVAASVVDHIIPHKGDGKLFWQVSNHQALCKSCHDLKTATEDGGFGRNR